MHDDASLGLRSQKNAFCGNVEGDFCCVYESFMALSPLGHPRIPHAKNFELVWADEFDGNDLDAAKWKGLGCCSGDPSVRRGSY